MNTIERARAYLAKLPPAIAGAGGHAATFAAACRLVEFGLSFEQAAPLLAEWNETHCQPHWTGSELSHKLADAFKRTSVKPQFVTGRREPVTRQADCDRICHISKPIPDPRAEAGAEARQAAPKAALPSSNAIPAARRRDHKTSEPALPPAESELAKLAPRFHVGWVTALAKLRGLSIEGVRLASARRLLCFGNCHGRAAWIVLDASRRNGCARRMDGQPWFASGAKSLIFRRAQAAWPIGILEARPFPKILLCEGAPDLLAAFHFIAAAGGVTDCAPVAMLSAVYRIPANALPLFTGKRVRIYAHDDETGYCATSRWAAQLEARGANVDAFSFAGLRTRNGAPVKDLNGFALAQPAENLLANLLP